MKQSGIYKIINKVNNKFYVGSSRNLRRRKRDHFSELKKNIHFNKHLQGAWNKYGGENFEFKIIENVLLEDKDSKKIISAKLQSREQIYINNVLSENKSTINHSLCYNISIDASKPPSSHNSKRGKKIARKRKLNNEDDLEIKAKYLSGISANKMGKEYSVSHSTIISSLKRTNTKRIREKVNGWVSKEARRQIVEEYKKGLGTYEIGKKFNVDKNFARRIILKSGTKIRSLRESKGSPSEKIQKEICKKYSEGKDSYALAEEYGFNSSTTICNILKKYNVEIRNSGAAHIKIPRSKESKICEKYLKGKNTVELGIEYEVSNNTISRILKRNDVEIRSRSERRKKIV